MSFSLKCCVFSSDWSVMCSIRMINSIWILFVLLDRWEFVDVSCIALVPGRRYAMTVDDCWSMKSCFKYPSMIKREINRSRSVMKYEHHICLNLHFNVPKRLSWWHELNARNRWWPASRIDLLLTPRNTSIIYGNVELVWLRSESNFKMSIDIRVQSIDDVWKTCRQLSHSVAVIFLHSDEENISPKYSNNLWKLSREFGRRFPVNKHTVFVDRWHYSNNNHRHDWDCWFVLVWFALKISIHHPLEWEKDFI